MQSEQFQLHAEIEQRHWWFVARRQILRRLAAELIPPSAQTMVVDIGCGTGANIGALAGDYRCVGIDTSAEAIELAERRFPEVEFLTGRAPHDLGVRMGQARLFVMTDVLEHVADDFAMLSELLGAASPGSYFLLTVPADESLWSEHDESFGHYRRYHRERLASLWAGLPVDTLLLSYFNSRLMPVIRAIRARNRRRGKASGHCGTDFWIPPGPINGALRAVMAGESKRLLGMIRGQASQDYPRGASLIAVLRRNEGPIEIRQKPAGLPPDHHVQ